MSQPPCERLRSDRPVRHGADQSPRRPGCQPYRRLLVRPLPAGSPARGSRWYRRRPAGTRV